MKKVLFILFLLAMNVAAHAQCAMCSATVESNSKESASNIAAGLNSGILYLMSVPYILFGILGYLWFKNSRKVNVRKA